MQTLPGSMTWWRYRHDPGPCIVCGYMHLHRAVIHRDADANSSSTRTVTGVTLHDGELSTAGTRAEAMATTTQASRTTMHEPPRRAGRPPLDKDDPSVAIRCQVPATRYDGYFVAHSGPCLIANASAGRWASAVGEVSGRRVTILPNAI